VNTRTRGLVRAYERGQRDAAEGRAPESCPYRDPANRDAWAQGYGVGPAAPEDAEPLRAAG
jgi:ribosome modulation factor